MTIRISQDLPVALGHQDSAEEPAGDAFALALRTRMRRDDQAAAPAREPARPARATSGTPRGAGHSERPGQREQLDTPRQVEGRDAARPSGEPAPGAITGGADALETAPAQPQAAPAPAPLAATAAPLPTDPTQPGPASGADPAQIVAAVNAAQAEAASVVSAQLAVTTQLQQAVIGQALVDPADAATREPLPSAFVTPTIVPGVEPLVVSPAEAAEPPAAALAASSAPVASVAVDAVDAGQLATTAVPPTTATATAATATSATATAATATAATATAAAATGPTGDAAWPESSSAAYGGAPMAGARPYVSGPEQGETANATRLGDVVVDTSAPSAPMAPNSIGAASGQLAPSAESATGAALVSPAPGGATPAGTAPAPAGATSGAVAQVAAEPSPEESVAALAVSVPLQATAGQSAATRVVLDRAVTDIALPSAPTTSPDRGSQEASPGAGSAPAPTRIDGLRQTESAPPPPPVHVAATPAHAPAVASPHANAPVAAAPPPAVHSQILSAMTPALQRRDGSYSVELQLDPASLGRVRVQVAIAGGEVSLHLASGDPGTRDLLRQHADQLRQQLSESGFGRSSVDVGDGSRGNAWQGPDRQPAGPTSSGQGQGDARRETAAGWDRRPTDDSAETLDHVSAARRTDGAGDAALDVRI